MKFIAAVDKNWGIGKNNKLLFNIPKDMKFFRETTTGKTVIMGRTTLESMPGGKPLLKRRNIVITKNKSYECEGAEIVYSVEEAVKAADDGAFVIGGAQIYKQMLPFCETAYITKVIADGCADCFIPNLDEDDEWILKKSMEDEDNGYKLIFCEYQRRKK